MGTDYHALKGELLYLKRIRTLQHVIPGIMTPDEMDVIIEEENDL